MRRRNDDNKSKKPGFRTPVICVGGLLAGGVGKTPIVRAIAARLSVPVIMRGYGAKCNHGELDFTSAVGEPVEEVGDEAKMLADSGAEVYVGNRASIIDWLSQIYSGLRSKIRPCAIVMDDGFQNPTLKKDISILVFDAKIGVGNGFCLPAGPMRELLGYGIKRADAIMVIGVYSDKNPNIERIIRIADLYKKPVFYAKNIQNTGKLKRRLFAFAGIGYPEKFFAGLRENGHILAGTASYPDHHFYSRAELESMIKSAADARAELVATEKDWVKIPVDLQKKIKFAPLETDIEPEFWKWIDAQLKRIK